MCFDDAGRQPDGAVFEVGSWQVFAFLITKRECMCVCVGSLMALWIRESGVYVYVYVLGGSNVCFSDH